MTKIVCHPERKRGTSRVSVKHLRDPSPSAPHDNAVILSGAQRSRRIPPR